MPTQVRSRRSRVPIEPSPTRPSRRLLLGAGIAVAAVGAGAVTWALWPEPPRQRDYLDATACLLTDEKGVAAEPAGSVWTAMQDASAGTLVKVQYLPVGGPRTAENVGAHLASLAGGGCNVVIAVGESQVETVAANAAAYPDVRFLTAGGVPSAGVHVIDASAGTLRIQIREQLETVAETAS